MRLDPFVRDYPSFMKELVEALESDSTHFYLDTSLLMWLIRLGTRARAEFISWCESRPLNAVRIPVWAAHELHRHLISGTVRANLQKTVNETQAKYDEFARLASERADEAFCRSKGFAGRDSYISELERSFARFGVLARVVDMDEAQLQQAADEVIAFVNSHVLTSDIAPVVEKLSRTGEFRYSHLVPPGFQDRKDENRYGDVIIWEELVEDMRAAGPDTNGHARNAVLVSRDKKTDWVSAAPLVRNVIGDAQKSNRDQGLDVTLAHPLLVHEFAARAGGNQLYVAHPGFLASTLDYAARSKGRLSGVGQWLAASHRPDLLGRLAALSLSSPSPTPPYSGRAAGSAAPSQPASPVATMEVEGLGAVTVSDVMTSSVASELRRYQEALPQEQEELVGSWVAALREGSLSAYKFGRILADLAVSAVAGFAERLPGFLESLSEQVEVDRLNRIALAIITSAYFDRYGYLQRRPHIGLGAIALTFETQERLVPAFAALQRFLTTAGAMLPYIPGSGRNHVHLVLDIVPGAANAPRAIRDIRVGGQSALADSLGPGSPRRLTALLGREPTTGCSLLELRALIAREYLIPPDCLGTESDKNDKKKLTWPPDAGLVTLDTQSDGGLSALADEENNDA